MQRNLLSHDIFLTHSYQHLQKASDNLKFER